MLLRSVALECYEHDRWKRQQTSLKATGRRNRCGHKTAVVGLVLRSCILPRPEKIQELTGAITLCLMRKSANLRLGSKAVAAFALLCCAVQKTVGKLSALAARALFVTKSEQKQDC